jgi:integrase
MTVRKPGLTTDRQVAALKPGASPYEASIGGARGLSVRVFPSGAKQWVFRYVAKNGTRRRMPLGDYPGLPLADATTKAAARRVEVVDGEDPAAERLAERKRARTGETLQELADAYFAAAEKGLHREGGRPKRPSSVAVEKTRFKVHIKPKLGDRRFAEIGRSDIKQHMRELASGSIAPDTVASVGRTLSAILAFAVHEERLGANPAAGLTQPLALRERDRMFSDESLAAIWKALRAPLPEGYVKSPRKPKAGAPKRGAAEPAISLALQLALLTLTRRSDVADADWAEFDLAARSWAVPAARHKSRHAHVVPLGDEAIRVLEEAARLNGGAELDPKVRRSGPVFRSPVNHARAITAHGITRALSRTCKDLNLTAGSPHDFRRCGATHLTGERLGFRRFVVSKVLGHAAHDGARHGWSRR